MSPTIQRSCSADRPTPLIPPKLQFQPIDHPALPHQSDNELKATLHLINETWSLIQKLLVRINQQQLAAFKRQHHFEVIASEQIECMQKDLNLLRGHMNRANNEIEQLKQIRQHLAREVEVDETQQSESVDEVQIDSSRQAQMH